MTISEMLRHYTNKIIEDGIMNCTNFDITVSLYDYGDNINLAKYKNEILKLLYEDERIADVTIDDDNCIDMVFYTDYCPYYYEEDEKLDIFNELEEANILKEFAYYYSEQCLFNKPYLTTMTLINDFIEQKKSCDKKEAISNILKKNIAISGFIEKNIENAKVFVTPRNYKELEKIMLNKARKIESKKKIENEEEFE